MPTLISITTSKHNFELRRLFTLLFLLLSIIPPAIIVTHAWHNNPNCAFYCNNLINWDNLGSLAFATFAVWSVPALYISSITYLLLRTLLGLWRTLKKD